MATFNEKFEYNNVGTIVGTICFVKELTRKSDGSVFGHEFLLNVKGHGSVNVRVPMLSKSQPMADKFPAKNRPHVRINLAQIDMYHNTNNGRIYTNFISFNEFKEVGADVEDTIKGLVKGEVLSYKDIGNNMKVKLVVFPTDKDGNLRKRYDGTPFDSKEVIFEIEDALLNAQFKSEVQNGTNVGIGYTFVNKTESGFDEWGFPITEGKRVTKALVEKIVVLNNGKPQESAPPIDDNPFGAGDDFFINDDDIPF